MIGSSADDQPLSFASQPWILAVCQSVIFPDPRSFVFFPASPSEDIGYDGGKSYHPGCIELTGFDVGEIDEAEEVKHVKLLVSCQGECE